MTKIATQTRLLMEILNCNLAEITSLCNLVDRYGNSFLLQLYFHPKDQLFEVKFSLQELMGRIEAKAFLNDKMDYMIEEGYDYPTYFDFAVRVKNNQRTIDFNDEWVQAQFEIWQEEQQL